MPEAINDMKINSVNINVSRVLFIQKKEEPKLLSLILSTKTYAPRILSTLNIL